MQLTIRHKTSYQFDGLVFFEPHFLRFRPADEHYLTVSDFQLDISPQPAGISAQKDVENNVFHLCWFGGLHSELNISMSTTVHVLPFDPFHCLIYPASALTIPFNYPAELKHLLQPSLKAMKLSPEMELYRDGLLKTANNDTSAFILELTRQIHRDFETVTREEGAPLCPKETFALKKGSCRDLAWMQIHLLRHLGLAARVVSGYYYLDVEEPFFELHAWLEVYLPGAGWRGFDPSHGIAAGHTHIPVAKSTDYRHTMPVSGTIRGEGRSRLSFTLSIEAAP